VWRLARTLCDLDGVDAIDEQRLMEAMSFRALEREERVGA
jgi:predicted ATPase with chaperone activity